MERIRVVVVGLPQILRDVIVDIVAGQPDIEVVAELAADASLAVVKNLDASVVAMSVGPSGELPEIGWRLLATPAADLRILGLSSEGRSGFLYQLRPSQVAIGEVSPERLLSVISGAVSIDQGEAQADRFGRRPNGTGPNAGLT
jgi:hypothetical protein